MNRICILVRVRIWIKMGIRITVKIKSLHGTIAYLYVNSMGDLDYQFLYVIYRVYKKNCKHYNLYK